MKKLIGIIYGGNSVEHEVSKMTARSIIDNIDRDKFDIREIFIERDGTLDESLLNSLDAAFLAVHGPNCEDGKLQSFLEGKGIKYTGPKVEASRINMDKILMHDRFREVGLPVVKYVGFNKEASVDDIIGRIEKEIGYPCFIKPANGGSSIGISKVENINELKISVEDAFKYDEKIIAEEAVINPREIEVAIMGNDELFISEPGEILSGGEFYSYDSKYFAPFETDIKAKLTEEQVNTVKKMAETAYRSTGCSGYSRVDFFLDAGGRFYINEINTLPGFTKTSMFPVMMQASGISYKDLITEIIDLA